MNKTVLAVIVLLGGLTSWWVLKNVGSKTTEEVTSTAESISAGDTSLHSSSTSVPNTPASTELEAHSTQINSSDQSVKAAIPVQEIDESAQREYLTESESVIVVDDKSNVIVPETYAVEDAAKYFVPRELRKPGNLGGPPPLPDFGAITPDGIAPPQGLTLPQGIAPPRAPE